MRKSTPAVLFAVLTLAACTDDPAGPGAAAPPDAVAFARSAQADEVIPDRYIVVLRDDAGGPEGVPGLAQRLARESGGTVGYVYEHAVRGFSIALDADGAARLARHPLVASVEQEQVVRASIVQSGATWGLDRIDQRALPLSTTFAYTRTGTGVTAYIVDTGILYGHVDLGGRAVAGYDAFGGTGADCNGHGTHVAGTVGGTTYGVAKGVRLVAVRVLDCNGSGSTAGVIAGVDWVAANHAAGAPAVANMSLGGGASSTLDQAVQRAIADGVTFAVAAGNGNWFGWAQNACNYSPARVADAITVSATDKADKKASYANYGTCVDLFAPGNSITSSWHTSVTATNTISGTSMATPHVAGVAALYLEGAPAATPLQVRDAIVAGATTGVVTSAGTGSPNRLLYTAY